MGDQPSPLQGRRSRGYSKKDRPPNPWNPACGGTHDFEHDALVPGPGNAEHFSLAFTTWRKVKGGNFSTPLDPQLPCQYNHTTKECFWINDSTGPSVFYIWGSGRGFGAKGMKNYFAFAEHGTSYKQETLAGITTFLTMAYIVVVNPAILEAAGIPKGPSMTATALSAAFGTLIMGFYAKRPFAIAPYMGENAFIAFTVVKGLGYPWQTALGAIFLAGVLFTVLTVAKVRGWLAETLPRSLKYSFSVGIGLFLAFIGMNETGIVVLGVPGAPVSLGNLSQPSVLLAVLGFIIIAWLMIKRVMGAVILGILVTTLLSFWWGISAVPKSVMSLPPSLGPIFMELSISDALSLKSLPGRPHHFRHGFRGHDGDADRPLRAGQPA